MGAAFLNRDGKLGIGTHGEVWDKKNGEKQNQKQVRRSAQVRQNRTLTIEPYSHQVGYYSNSQGQAALYFQS